MIVAKLGGKSGIPVLFIGLSGENVARLAAGEPIHIAPTKLARMGLPKINVVVHYGRTEGDILTELRAHGVLP